MKTFFGAILVNIVQLVRKGYHFFSTSYYKSKCYKCGEDVYLGHELYMTWQNLLIGSHVYIGNRCSFILTKAKCYIGDYVMFGPNVTIRGGDHRTDVIGKYMFDVKEKLPENDVDVVIEDDVWIGCNVTILKGVHIGRGSVIGAGSVVVKDVPPYTIHVGSGPIKEFERFNKIEIIEHETKLKQ